MWRRQQLTTGFRAGWRNPSGTRQAILAGTGFGIMSALIALVVTQPI